MQMILNSVMRPYKQIGAHSLIVVVYSCSKSFKSDKTRCLQMSHGCTLVFFIARLEDNENRWYGCSSAF